MMRSLRAFRADPLRVAILLTVMAGAVLILVQTLRLLSDRTDPRQRLAVSLYDQAALRDLALAERATGHGDSADALAELSGRLGWRDRETQRLLIDAAIRRGDDGAAMRHVDALLRRRPALEPALLPALHAAAVDGTGRTALLLHLKARPAWRTAFFQRIDAIPPALRDAHEALLEVLARQGQLDRTGELVPYVQALAATGEAARARNFWLRLTGAEQGAVLDPDFERLRLDRTADRIVPFEWTTRRQPGADMRLVSGAGGRSLVVGVDRSAFGALLFQQLVLGPGRYRLITVTPSHQVMGLGVLRWTLRCLPGGTMVAMAGAPETFGWREDFAVPADGCTTQIVALEARRADGPSYSEARFDRITITPVGGAGR
ncbi:hypothetical protein [Sphingomonas sp. SORGH_AS_0879]|uniref:hypothetical protein n=1 Tax=Sphingomonas sp. SORGH_AS_0879 TaxID=3041790 RepID=UPI0027813587|nr:hypothetical protein [Sphingomonas sp. SORGH_AS_0879]MDQ1231253.1 hypothetical protein [Sphingomonas sp. SORGH_AS_0879]